MPLVAIASAVSRINCSLMLPANLFQLFQPIGGVRASPVNFCAWTLTPTKAASASRMAVIFFMVETRITDCGHQSCHQNRRQPQNHSTADDLIQPVHRFQTGARRVIWAFPFADLRQFFVGSSVRVDAPEPFAVDMVNEIFIYEFPGLQRGGKKSLVARKLKRIQETDKCFCLRPALAARINDPAIAPFV